MKKLLILAVLVILGVFLAPYISMIDFTDLGSVESDPKFIYLLEGR